MLYTQTLKTAYLFSGPTLILLWYFVLFRIHLNFKVGFTIPTIQTEYVAPQPSAVRACGFLVPNFIQHRFTKRTDNHTGIPVLVGSSVDITPQ